MPQYDDADTYIIQKDKAHSDNECAKSKPSKTNKQRKVDKKRVTVQKAQILSSNDDERIETSSGKEKNASQNNIQLLPKTSSSSSALSCLMGMVKRNHTSQEEIDTLPSSDAPINENFNNNHFNQAFFEKGGDTDISNQVVDEHITPVNDTTRNSPQSSPYFDAACPESPKPPLPPKRNPRIGSSNSPKSPLKNENPIVLKDKIDGEPNTSQSTVKTFVQADKLRREEDKVFR